MPNDKIKQIKLGNTVFDIEPADVENYIKKAMGSSDADVDTSGNFNFNSIDANNPLNGSIMKIGMYDDIEMIYFTTSQVTDDDILGSAVQIGAGGVAIAAAVNGVDNYIILSESDAQLNTMGSNSNSLVIKSYVDNYHDSTKQNVIDSSHKLDYSLIANTPTLATVATSGSYNDLSNKPTIPTIPTNVSAFTNDVGYLTGNSSLKNTKVSWGGPNIVGDMSPFGFLSYNLNGNRLNWFEPSLIYEEYSTDGGQTWTDYERTSGQKTNLYSDTDSNSPLPIGRKLDETNPTVNSQSRITFTCQNGSSYALYTNPKLLLINVSKSNTMYVKIETRTGTNYLNDGPWSLYTNDDRNLDGKFYLSGWSAWNEIPLVLTTLGGSSGQTANNWQLRLTFVNETVGASPHETTAHVYNIKLYGQNNWLTTNVMARSGVPYTIDYNKYVSFFGSVNAPTLYENNTALSNKYLLVNNPQTVIGNITASDFIKNGYSVATVNDLSAKADKASGLTSGTYTKLSVNSDGIVTSGSSLSASDIPSLSANKITSGTFPDARIASASTWNSKSVVSGSHSDGNWTSITINGTTKSIPAGGGPSGVYVTNVSVSGNTLTVSFSNGTSVDYTLPSSGGSSGGNPYIY